jgi:hypothetical protein
MPIPGSPLPGAAPNPSFGDFDSTQIPAKPIKLTPLSSTEGTERTVQDLFDTSTVLRDLAGTAEAGTDTGTIAPATVIRAKPAISTAPAASAPSRPTGKAALIIENSTPEEKAKWAEAFANWQKSNPGGSEKTFAIYILAGTDIDPATLKFATDPNLLKFAGAVLLGNENKIRLYNGLTILLSTTKHGAPKINIYSKDLGRIGKGGNNAAEKCIKISFKVFGDTVVSKGEKSAVHRFALKPTPAPAPNDVGNRTLYEIGETIKEYARTHNGALPKGVALDAKGWPVGIQKPLKEFTSEDAYGKHYVGGSFNGWIENTKPSIDQILTTFKTTQHGLAATIFANALNTDLKPPNVFVDEAGNGNLGDWSGVTRGLPVPDKNPDGTPLNAEQVLDFVQKNPIDLQDLSLTPNFNLFSDFIEFTVKEEAVHNKQRELEAAIASAKLIEEDKNQLIAEARKKGQHHLIPDLMDSDTTVKKMVEDKAAELVKARNDQIDVIQKILIFQSAMTLYTPLMGEGIVRSAKNFIIAPPNAAAIEKSVNKLGLPPDRSSALKQYFAQTIGQKIDKRAAFLDTWDAYDRVA